MPEFKCEKCGGDIVNKNYRLATTDTIFPSTCISCDYERAVALEKDTQSIKEIREATMIFRMLGDYLDASIHVAQCEDRAKALIKKRRSRVLLICSGIAVAITIISLIFSNLPMIKHMFDSKKNTKNVVIYEEEDVQYVILPYADSIVRYFLRDEMEKNAFWIQPNGDCIVMFYEEIGGREKTRFYRYDSDWQFQNELELDLSFSTSKERKPISKYVRNVCQTISYNNYSPAMGLSYCEKKKFGTGFYNVIVSYDEQKQTITPIQTFYPNEFNEGITYDALDISIKQICNVADTYIVLWEWNKAFRPYTNNSIWSVVLQDENNLIWTFSGYDMESVLQSQFNLKYESAITFDIAADDSFYYICSWFSYTDNGKELSDALLITIDRFGNTTPLLLSSLLPELEDDEYITYGPNNPYGFYYDSFSELMTTSLTVNNENDDPRTVFIQYDPKAQQKVYQVEPKDIPYPGIGYTYPYIYLNGSRYVLRYLTFTPVQEKYKLEYLEDPNADCDFTVVIVVEKMSP